MDRKYEVVAAAERESLSEAQDLVRRLRTLRVAAEIKVVDTVTELVSLSEEQLLALGTINFQDFSELMQANGVTEDRADRLWGDLLRNTPFITKTEAPLYEVDREAILDKIKQKSPRRARRLQNTELWEELLAKQSLDLTELTHEIQGGEINDRSSIGPVSVDELTMLINLRVKQIAQAENQEPEEQL